MTPNPFLNQVRRRIAMTGGWSRHAKYPQAKRPVEKPQHVFVLIREGRHFAVVAKNLDEAETRLTATLAVEA